MFPPLAPVALDRLRHVASRLAEPSATALAKIAEDTGTLARAPQMHVGRLPSHHIEQAILVAAAREARELDAAAVGREAAYQPLAVEAQAGIRNAHRPADDLAIACRAQPSLPRPQPRGRTERLRLARHHGAVPAAER